MWIEDLTKALYYLNVTDIKYKVTIDFVHDGRIQLSSGRQLSVKYLVTLYDRYIKTGDIVNP